MVDLTVGEVGFAKLKAKEYDALITVGMFLHPDVDCVAVGPVLPAVLMSKTHPLVSKESISLSDLESYPIATSDRIDLFNETIVSTYKKRGFTGTFVNLTVQSEVDPFLEEKQGLALVVGIPSLGELHQGAEMRFIAPEDSVPIPLCLATLKTRKTPAYLAFEHWVTNEAVLFAGMGNTAGKLLGK